MAIKMALLWLKNSYQTGEDKQNVAIFSDSLSVLTAIKTEHSKCRRALLDEILRLINEIAVSIEFIWVSSHLGIKGNEYVDKLAQDAITKNVTDIDCCFEIFEHNKLILNVL